MPFNYRSTNTTGFTHHGGALVVGTEAGSGIELNPTSSGDNAIIVPAGDETNKSLTIKGKGAGGVAIGSSGSNILDARAFTVQFTPPALSSGQASVSVAQSTHTVTGLSTGTLLIFTPTGPIANAYTVRPHCSTVNELRLMWGNTSQSTLGTGESTNRGTLLQFRF